MDVNAKKTMWVETPAQDPPLFEDLLLQLKTVTLSQLNEVKANAKQNNEPVSKVLVQKNLVSPAEMEALSLIQKNYLERCQQETQSSPAQSPQERRNSRDRRKGGRRSSDRSTGVGEPLERIFRASNALAKYQIIEEISRGGMGIVYKARDLDLQRIVAIKIIREVQEAHHSQILRFQKEAEVLARLQHPNIVPIYDNGNSDGVRFLVMKYIDGVTMEEYIHNDKFPLTPKIVIELLIKIARAVEYMHQNKVIHRDLKPSNIMIDQQGEPHIMDFGLAKLLSEDDRQITRCGVTMGTPAYISPEQALGDNANLNEKTDIYALGGILYESLTLHPPFSGQNVLYILNQVVYKQVKPPRIYNTHITPALESVCLKALAKRPGDRYSSAKLLAEDLDRLLKGQSVTAQMKPPLLLKSYLNLGMGPFLGFCFLVVLYWITAPGSSKMAEELRFKSMEAYLIKNWPSAIEYANQSLSVEPKEFKPYLLRAQVHHSLGDSEQAFRDLQRFLSQYPQSPAGLELLQQIEKKKAPK